MHFERYRDLIKEYRACTTSSEERALVKKEAAHIRDLFREGDKAFRRQNIAKLLFFHMNGYPTNFGMTECIKLCASAKYSDKRVAYLGLMILVDETEEILMLMTNCLKQDLHSGDPHITSLALTVLGDIASVEMVRDLLPEIEMHMEAGNPYIRKKAALAAVRACRKLDADETPNVLMNMPRFFEIRSSAVHIAGSALVVALSKQSASHLSQMRKTAIPVMVNILRDHLLSPSSRSGSRRDADSVIGGVDNPFLQVKLIGALHSIAGPGTPKDYVDGISDVLAQVASNTDTAKITGCAVLYECVRAIIAMDTEQSLRSLAVTILGKFLGHKEATVRYIALQELIKVVQLGASSGFPSIEEYRPTILLSLSEADPTVRKRGVELVYYITNAQNVVEMVSQLLSYLERSDSEDLAEDACRKIYDLLDRFGSSGTWRVDTFVRALELADMAMPEDLITAFAAMVSSDASVQSHAASRLFTAGLEPHCAGAVATDPFEAHSPSPKSEGQSKDKRHRKNRRKPRLERVSLYILGEYGDAALGVTLDVVRVIDAIEKTLAVSLVAAGSWVDSSDMSYNAEIGLVRESALTTLVKLACRMSGGTNGTGYGGFGHDVSGAVGLSALELPAAPLALMPPSFTAENGGNALAITTVGTAPATSLIGEGLGSDILASMGLGDSQSGSSTAVAVAGPASTSLVAKSTGVFEDDLIGGGGYTPGEDEGSAHPIVVRVRHILALHRKSMDLETQQRACEYARLLSGDMATLRATVLARMPPMDYAAMQERAAKRREASTSMAGTQKKSIFSDDLLLLLDDENESNGAAPSSSTTLQGHHALPAGSELLALPPTTSPAMQLGPGGSALADLLDGVGTSDPANDGAQTGQPLVDGLMSLSMSNGESAVESEPTTLPLVAGTKANARGSLGSTDVFSSQSLSVHAQFFLDNAEDQSVSRAEVIFSNLGNTPMSNFVFQLAVPKYVKLQMQPASSSEIAPGSTATQSVAMVNTMHGTKPVQWKYRVEYSQGSGGEVVREQGVATGLPPL